MDKLILISFLCFHNFSDFHQTQFIRASRVNDDVIHVGHLHVGHLHFTYVSSFHLSSRACWVFILHVVHGSFLRSRHFQSFVTFLMLFFRMVLFFCRVSHMIISDLHGIMLFTRPWFFISLHYSFRA